VLADIGVDCRNSYIFGLEDQVEPARKILERVAKSEKGLYLKQVPGGIYGQCDFKVKSFDNGCLKFFRSLDYLSEIEYLPRLIERFHIDRVIVDSTELFDLLCRLPELFDYMELFELKD